MSISGGSLVFIRFLRGAHVWAWRRSVWLVLFAIAGFDEQRESLVAFKALARVANQVFPGWTEKLGDDDTHSIGLALHRHVTISANGMGACDSRLATGRFLVGHDRSECFDAVPGISENTGACPGRFKDTCGRRKAVAGHTGSIDVEDGFGGRPTEGDDDLGLDVEDLLAAGINQNVGGWRLSPGATEIELHLVRFFAEQDAAT